MKTKFSTDWPSGCSGCHVAVADLHEKLVNLAAAMEFARLPILMDEKGYSETEVGIVEVAARRLAEQVSREPGTFPHPMASAS